MLDPYRSRNRIAFLLKIYFRIISDGPLNPALVVERPLVYGNRIGSRSEATFFAFPKTFSYIISDAPPVPGVVVDRPLVYGNRIGSRSDATFFPTFLFAASTEII